MKSRIIAAVWGLLFVCYQARLGAYEVEGNCCCDGDVFLFDTRLHWGMVKSRLIAAVRGQFSHYQARLRDCKVEDNCCCMAPACLYQSRLGVCVKVRRIASVWEQFFLIQC